MNYRTFFVESRDGKEADDIEAVLNTWAEDGYVLSSITPKVDEGTTEGFIIVFDATNAVR